MKKILQKSLSRLHALLLLAVMFVVGGSTAWAQDVSTTFSTDKQYQTVPIAVDSPIYSEDGKVSIVWSSVNKVDGSATTTSAQYKFSQSYGSYINLVGEFSFEAAAGYVITYIGISAPGASYYNTNNMILVSEEGTYSGSSGYWMGEAASVAFKTKADSYGYKYGVYATSIEVHYKEASVDPIDYTVNFTGEVPSGCSASYGDDTFTSNGTFSVAKNLKEEDLNITTTADYYADVTYNESEHSWNIEFKHYYYYNFVIEGSDDGYITNTSDLRNYYDGGQLKVKVAVPEERFEAADVNGYEKSEVSFEAVDAYTTNVKVTYTEKAAQTYTVTFPEDAPAGVSVTVYVDYRNPLTFTESGTFQTNLDLNASYFNVTTPATHWCESEWNCYDEDNHTFTVKLHEYLQYNVAVEGTTDANAGVKYDYQTYHAGDVIYTSYEITNSDLTAVDVNGYTSAAAVEGNTVKVTYTEIPAPTAPWSITFDAEGQAQCQIVNRNGDSKKWYGSSDYDYNESVYVPCYRYDYTNANGADDFILLPAVKLEAGKDYTVTVNCRAQSSNYSEQMEVVYGTAADVNALTKSAINTSTIDWTTRRDLSNDFNVEADGKYYFAIHCNSIRDRYYLYVYSFSITESTGPAPRENTVGLLTDFANSSKPWLSSATNPVLGEVSSLRSISIELDTNCEVAHWEGEGGNECPEEVTIEDANGNSYTISEFSYWANDTQVGVKLQDEITTPGVYTLTIPAGVVPCVDNKANKELVLTWTVVAPAPRFPEQGVDYKIALYNSVAYPDGGYLNVVTDNGTNGTVRRDTPEALNFIWDGAEGAFTIQDKDGNYIGGATGDNTWSCMPGVKEYWTVEEITDGVYAFKSKTSNYLGFNSIGNNAFRDMQKNNKRYDRDYYDEYMFTIEEILYPVATFNMSAAGWATLCIDRAFTVPEGYTAYTAGKDVEGVAVLEENGQIVLTEITDVHEGVGVIIEGPAASNIELFAPAVTPAKPDVNFLYGNPFDVYQDFNASFFAENQSPGAFDEDWEPIYGYYGPCQFYQLAMENDLVGFYRQVENGTTIRCGAHKAILVVPSTVASSNSRFVFPGQEGTLTGINAVAADDAEAIYNLQGQRVTATKAGVYVKNGRKFIVK